MITKLNDNTYKIVTRTIEVTLSNVDKVAQLQDGRIEVKPLTNYIHLLNYNSLDGSTGATVNTPGRRAPDIQGLRNVSPTTPINIGDVAIVASSLPGSGQCDDMVSIHVVPFDPAPNHLTGPAIGSAFNPINYWLRVQIPSGPIISDLISVDHLPSVINIDSLPVSWGLYGRGKPTLEWALEQLTFCGDIGDQWGLTGMPINLMYPYGREFSWRVSVMLLLLCSTLPKEQKKPLVTRLAQAAIDLWGAYLDGRVQETDGGHYQGRKAVVLAGLYILGIDKIHWPLVLKGQYQEDLAYADLGPLPWNPSWRYGWRGHSSQPHPWNQPLNTWASHPGRPIWYGNNYLHAQVGTQIGTALAMKLMGLTEYMGKAHYGFVSQWMEGPNSSGATALAGLGILPPWGTDFTSDRASTFCAEAWKKYN